jgi:hypothetical protein
MKSAFTEPPILSRGPVHRLSTADRFATVGALIGLNDEDAGAGATVTRGVQSIMPGRSLPCLFDRRQ